jgi:Flp pilus assembly protein TadG
MHWFGHIKTGKTARANAQQDAHKRSRWRGVLADNRGGALIEFAMVSPAYIAMVIASIQTGLVYFDAQALQMVADKVSRQLLTGVLAKNLGSQTQTQAIAALVNANLPWTMNKSTDKVYVDIQAASNFSDLNTQSQAITFDSNGTVSNNFVSTTSVGSGKAAVLKLYYIAPTIIDSFNFGNNKQAFNISNTGTNGRLIVATDVFRAE